MSRTVVIPGINALYTLKKIRTILSYSDLAFNMTIADGVPHANLIDI